MDVVGYVRVSTEEQASQGVSVDAQRKAIEAYCALRGLNLVAVLTDEAVSGSKPLSSRPAGAQLVEIVKRRKVQAVIAMKLDRLFRDASDCLDVTKTWDKGDVSLHLIDMGGQSLDSSSTMGRFFLTVMAGAAEMERNLIRDRTKAALQHKKARGERVGQIPYGYDVGDDGSTLVELRDEQAVIVRIKDHRAKGMTLARIAETLNGDNVPARGKRWYPMTVSRILKAAA